MLLINLGKEDSFQKVFSHNTVGGLFSSKQDALSRNPDNPNAHLFSILDKLENYRNNEGRFHLKLCFPEVSGAGGGHCNEWTQTSNPATETTITGFKAISLAFTKTGDNNPWAGLGRSQGSSNTLIDDAPSEHSWWSAIGATVHSNWLQAGSIPGPVNHGVKRVELYAHTGNVKSTVNKVKY